MPTTPQAPTGRRRGTRPSILAVLRDRRPAPAGRHVAGRPITGAVDLRTEGLTVDFPGPDSALSVDARYVHAVGTFGVGALGVGR